MHFTAPEKEEMESIRKWRNSNKQNMMLRTPYLLTAEMQDEFYKSKIANRNANCRFWSVYSSMQKKNIKSSLGHLIGLAGLENIQYENRIAEISVITDPKEHRCIPDIVAKLLEVGFNKLNLKSIFTEVYGCSPYREIWQTIAETHGAFEVHIPFRKYHAGQYYNSTIYTFALQEVPDNGYTSIESPCAFN